MPDIQKELSTSHLSPNSHNDNNPVGDIDQISDYKTQSELLFQQHKISDNQQSLIEYNVGIADVHSLETCLNLVDAVSKYGIGKIDAPIINVGCIDRFADMWSVFTPDVMVICDPSLNETPGNKSKFKQPEQVIREMGVTDQIKYEIGSSGSYDNLKKVFTFDFQGHKKTIVIYADLVQNVTDEILLTYPRIGGLFAQHIGGEYSFEIIGPDATERIEFGEKIKKSLTNTYFVDKVGASLVGVDVDHPQIFAVADYNVNGSIHYLQIRVDIDDSQTEKRSAIDFVSSMVNDLCNSDDEESRIRQIISDRLSTISKYSTDMEFQFLLKSMFNEGITICTIETVYYNDVLRIGFSGDGKILKNFTSTKSEIIKKIMTEIATD